jgi:hypothetical protein
MELRERHPALRVLYVSGYAQDRRLEVDGSDPRTQFLPKPFTGLALLAKVRATLDAG